MIGVNGVGQHLAVRYLITKIICYGSIIDTPAFVIASGSGAVTPPAIGDTSGCL